MKIIHLAINSPFTDDWSYQENILAKLHQSFGNDVTIITTNLAHSDNGEIVEVPDGEYFLSDGVKVVRKKAKTGYFKRISSILAKYDIYNDLVNIDADFIMVHGLIGSSSLLKLIKLKKKNPRIKIVADTHQDFNNTPFSGKISHKLIRFFLRKVNKRFYSILDKIYYVAPSTKDFAIEYFKVPIEKLEFLPLGTEISETMIENRADIRKTIRASLSIKEDEILIVHGGKLGRDKKTKELITAFLEIENTDIRLILFGPIADDYKQELEDVLKTAGSRVIMLGFLSPHQYYDIFLASDIAVFPGGQSVMWQQAVSCGLAGIFMKHPGVEYLNMKDNAIFLDANTKDNIKVALLSIIQEDRYKKMKKGAELIGVDFFSYEKISKKVLM